MQITGIEVFQKDLPYPGVYKLSGGREFTSFKTTIVCLKTDTGLLGWGESCPFGGTYIEGHPAGVLAAIIELSPNLLGLDPRDPSTVYAKMDSVLAGQAAAKSAIDIAVWDLAGKAEGAPVYELIGGLMCDNVPSISSISSDSPEKMLNSVRRHSDLGFTHHSIKIGAALNAGGPSMEAERLTTVLRHSQPDDFFLVDANGSLTLDQAKQLFALLPENLNFVLEAPCATWGETLLLRDFCPYPIMLDELAQTDGDVGLAIQLEACDGINLKLGKQGGISRCVTQRALCASSGLSMSIQDTWGAEISLSAILQVAASTPGSMLSGALDTRPLVKTSLGELSNDVDATLGRLQPPQLPGIGFEPNPALVGEPIIYFN